MLAVKKTIQRIGIIIFACLCLLASLTTVIILTTPYLNNYHQSFSTYLTKALDVPVKIDRVSAGWYWLYPKFKLTGVTILNHEHTRIAKLRQIDLGINLWRSLIHKQWIPTKVIVSGADVMIERNIQGQWQLSELSNKTTYEIPQHVLSWVFLQKRFQLDDVNIQLRLADGRVFPFKHLMVKLINKDHHHNIRAFGKLAQMVPTQFKLSGFADGNAKHLDELQGQFIIQVRDLELSQWLRSTNIAGLIINNGKVDANLKLKFAGKNYQQINGFIDGQNINVQVKGTEHARLLQHIRSSFNALHNSKHWQFRSPSTEIRVQGRIWPVNKLYLVYENTDKPFILTKIHYLKATPFLTLLKHNMSTPSRIRHILNKLNPRGELVDLKLQYGLHDQSWSVQTDFHDLSTSTWEDIPGFQHLSGHLKLAPHRGQLALRGHQLVVRKHNWLKEDFPINILMADVSWENKAHNWHVAGENIYMQSDFLDVNGSFSLKNFNRQSLGNLEMNGGYSLNHGKHLADIFPIVKLNDELAQWLNFAINDQGKASGNFVIHGDLNRFPFKDNSGTFLVSSQLDQAHLKFEPNWPAIENVMGELTFRNNAMTAKIFEATILDIPFNDVDIDIPDMGKDKKVLRIRGHVDSDFDTARNFIAQSPLIKKLALISKLKFSGPVRVNLDLKIPLLKSKPNIIDGAVVAKGAELNVDDWHLGIKKIFGKVDFHDEFIDGKGISAELFEQPVAVSIDTKDKKTRVRLAGELNMANLPEAWHLHQEYVSGQTNVEAVFTLPHDEAKIRRLQVMSDLNGVTLNYPQPFKKSANEAWPLKLTGLFYPNDNITIISNLSKLANVHGEFHYANQHLNNQGMTIHFGKPTTEFKPAKGIRIDGTIEHLNVKEWLQVYKQLEHHDLPVGDISDVDLKVKDLLIYNMRYPKTRFKLKPNKDHWLMQVKGQDIQGQISIPNSAQPIKADFKQLKIAKLELSKDSMKVDASAIPNLDLNIRNLIYQNKPLGQCRLQLKPTQHHVAIDNFSLKAKQFVIRAKGEWDDVSHKTKLNGDFKVSDFKYLQDVFSVPQFLKASDGEMAFDLAWDKDFYTPTLSDITGDIKFEVDHGKIIHLDKYREQQIGFGKFLSLISLQALPHHLATDFRDVSGKGFPFSSWQGKVKLTKGKASITKSELDGPVAYIEFDGDINLVDKQCLVQVKVVPYLGGTLPVLAAVAGGPVIGMATFMATEIIGSEIKRNAHYAYSISGPIDKLRINQIYRPQGSSYHRIH